MSKRETGEDIFLAVLKLRQRCRQMRSAAEDEALIAQAEADRARLEQDRARRQQVEAARDSDAWLKKKCERAVADEEAKLAAGLVEVRIDPGKRWDLAWFQANVACRLEGFDPRNLDPNLGVLAIYYGLQRLEDRLARGRRPASPGGFVVTEARAVMAGKRTMWVTQTEAQKTPHLVVRDNTTTYVGRLWEQWDQRQKDLEQDATLRQRRGLRPSQGDARW